MMAYHSLRLTDLFMGLGLCMAALINSGHAYSMPPPFVEIPKSINVPTPLSSAPSSETPPRPEIQEVSQVETHSALNARGVLQSRQTTHIAANLSARILKSNYKPGQSFKRGAPLIRFDCAQLKAETLALKAQKTSAKFSHDNVSELFQAGAAGELEVILAAAKVSKADAELGVVKVKQKNCTIYAPYNGIVQTAHISAYDTPALNAPLLTIFRSSTPEIKLIAPSAWMRWIKPGLAFDFTIDETGKTHRATIIRSGASVDPVSQTIELTAKFKTGAKGALIGMSGYAHFPSPQNSQEQEGKAP